MTADSYLKDKSLWEALMRTPLLVVSKDGKVFAIQGYEGIEWRFNGLQDLMFQNLQSAASAIAADNIKRIELKDQLTEKGKILVVNVVSKTRIEGLAGYSSVRLSDRLSGGNVFALTKIKRFTASMGYANSWIFDHSSKSIGKEYRLEGIMPDYEYVDKNHGYNVDSHTFEFSSSYDMSSKTILSLGGTLWLKTSPNYIESGEGDVKSIGGEEIASYKYDGRWKSNADIEYDVVANLQHEFENGSMSIKYNFYGRQRKDCKYREYESVSYEDSSDLYKDLFSDFRETSHSSYFTHNFEFLLNKSFVKSDRLSLRANLRYIKDFDFSEEGYCHSDNIITSTNNFRHSQGYGMIFGSYLRDFGDKIRLVAAVNMKLYHNAMKDNDYVFGKWFSRLSPSLSVTVLPSPKTRVTLDYYMNPQVPDIKSLNPYKDYTEPGCVTYGNPDLKPEDKHQLNLSAYYFPTKNAVWRITSANRFSNNLILKSSFLDSDLLHKTFLNAASCKENTVSIYYRSKSWVIAYSLFSSINYVDYSAYEISGIGKGENGWYWHNVADLTFELPRGWSLNLNSTADTRHVYFQGKGGAYYTYGMKCGKYFLNGRMYVSVYCNNPVPVYKNTNSYVSTEEYYGYYTSRDFNANFGASLSLRFGSLKSRVKGDRESIEKSDIKSVY